MWVVAPAGSTSCEVCGHLIEGNQPCISEIPGQVPESIDRRIFRHFHLDCPECESGFSCYQVHVSQLTALAAQKNTDCAYCGHTIKAGESIYWDYCFTCPEDLDDNVRDSSAGIAGLSRVNAKSMSFSDLSPKLKLRIRTGGLGNGRGIRTPLQAAEFYRSSIPRSVRNLAGEQGIWDFIKGKDVSHKVSVAHAPGRAKEANNSIWEPFKINRSRGSRNMTMLEKANTSVKNKLGAFRISSKAIAVNAAKSARFAVLLEAPVSALENAIYVLKGKKSRGEAAKDMAADIGTAGMVSGAVAFGVGLASTTVAGPAILAAAPVIGIVGMGIYGHSAYQRFKVALQDDDISPLTALPLYFHVECDDCDPGQACIELYATEVAFPFAHSRNGESPLA